MWGKNEICVCVHLTQTRYAQKVCAEMRGKMEYDFRNVVIDGKCEKQAASESSETAYSLAF